MSLLEILLILSRRDHIVDHQGQHGADHEDQNTDDRRQVVLGFHAAQSHLIQPGDQQVRVTHGNAAHRTQLCIQRVAAGQQVDHVKVIQVAHKAGQQGRTGDEQHVRQGDADVLLPRRCAVHTGRLIQVSRNIHQNTGSLQHHIGNADPNVDDDDHGSGHSGGIPNGGIVVLQQPLRNIGDLDQQLADNTGGVEQLGHIQQGNELGNGDGHDQGGSPEFLELDALLVDHHRHEHTQEIVGEGGKEGPHQRPAEDLAKGQAKAARTEVQQFVKVGHADPAEEVGITVVGGIVAGEGHQHHVDDGQHGEHQNTDQGERQQGLVELFVHQCPQIVLGMAQTAAGGLDLHVDAALLDLHSPGGHKGHDEHNGQQTIQHDLDRVIAGDPNIGVVNLVIDEAALDRTNGRAGLEPVALLQPVDAAAGNDHVADEYNFKQQKQQTAGDLAVENIAEAKNQEGQLHCPIALREGRADVHQLVPDGEEALSKEMPNAAKQVHEVAGDGAEEHQQPVEKCTGFA